MRCSALVRKAWLGFVHQGLELLQHYLVLQPKQYPEIEREIKRQDEIKSIKNFTNRRREVSFASLSTFQGLEEHLV